MLEKINYAAEKLEKDQDISGLSEIQIIELLHAKDAEISRLKESLGKSNQYINDFLYAAAHALKSPVANLNLIIILLEKTHDTSDLKNYLDTIKSSVKRLDMTINGLVQGFNVKVADETPVELIYFKDLLEEIKMNNLAEQAVFNSGLNENFDKCPHLVYCKRSLVDILNIIVKNSLKYRSDEREFKIEFETNKVDGYVLIEIKDNGKGIDLQKHEKDLFQPFKKFNANSEGMGMGLYLAKTLIEKNNGKISLESKPGYGTTVKCFLKEMTNK